MNSSGSARLDALDQSGGNLLIFLCVSILAHGLAFAGLMAFQDFHLPGAPPQVIAIDLVSFAPFPGAEDGGGGGGEAPAERVGEPVDTMPAHPDEVPETNTPADTVEEAPPAEIKPDISLMAKPKNLKELMADQEKKEKEAEKKKEEKIEKPKPPPVKKPDPAEVRKKQAAESTRDQTDISAALDRMRKKVAEQGSRPGGGGKGGTIGSGDGPGSGGGTGSGRKGYGPLDLYHVTIASAIEQNWVFNESLARLDRNLEVRILIKILKNGEIKDIIYETRSGNPYLDESAKRALLKINPLPPLPAGMNSYDLGLIFTPEGLK